MQSQYLQKRKMNIKARYPWVEHIFRTYIKQKKERTNIEGIFACGDCAVQPLQVSNAVGTGLIAGQNAAKYVDKINRK